MRPHLIHTSPLQVGHVAACVSFSQMAVSFTHIIKASEPVLSVALSGPLLGVNYPLYVWLSLLPIVAGCSMSAMKEVSFVWAGERQGVHQGATGGRGGATVTGVYVPSDSHC